MTTVFITGANRGIGRGLTEAFLARPDHIVIGAVRDPSSETATSLGKVTKGSGSKLLLVKLENTSSTDAAEAVKQAQAQGVTAIDIVIANAGISGAYARVDAIKVEDTRQMIEVNTLPIIVLFQAVLPLLKQSKNPKFVSISSNAASIVDMQENIPFILGSYGVSKAATNFLVRRIHFENDWLTAFSVHPGFAKTDMGNAGAKYFGFDEAFVPIQDSVTGVLSWVDKATKATESGNFYSFDGSEMKY